MNKEVSHLKRVLFRGIYRRLRSLKRETTSKYFNKYRALWTDRCKSFTNSEYLIKELKDENERIHRLDKKSFKIEFGKRRVWKSLSKNKSAYEVENQYRTALNTFNSKRLHKPSL